jgi:uncharacterized protein YbaP (TraB family)
MIRALFILTACAVLFTTQPSIAQPSTAQPFAAQPHKTIPIFWQITKPGTRDTSYLLGTYHLASSGHVKKMTRVMKAFNRSKLVVGEMVFDESSITSVLPHMMSTKPMQELMADSDYHFLDSVLTNDLGSGWQLAKGFKPIAVYVMLSMADAAGEDEESTTDYTSAMDLYFQTEAKRLHKKLLGLETAEEQASILFDSIPEDRQVQGLIQYIRQRSEQDSSSQMLEDDYYSGQVEEDLVLEGMEKAERSVLLDDRNQRWLAVLPKYIDQHAFIAVGAGHLGGPLGLIDGLRKRGYMLNPLELR